MQIKKKKKKKMTEQNQIKLSCEFFYTLLVTHFLALILNVDFIH